MRGNQIIKGTNETIDNIMNGNYSDPFIVFDFPKDNFFKIKRIFNGIDKTKMTKIDLSLSITELKSQIIPETGSMGKTKEEWLIHNQH